MRQWLIRWGLFFSFGVIFTGVFRLMIIRGKYYRDLARENKMEEERLVAPRGKIIDRKGRVVVESNPRRYVYGAAAAFVTGYTGKISEEEIRADKCKIGAGAEVEVGRGGVEDYFDCELRGKDGKRLIEVDAKGKFIRELGRLDPELGKDLRLSIDGYWQEKIYKLIEGRKAAVVISQPRTGKILNLISAPAYDPNVFSFERDNLKIRNYLGDDKNLQMLNRAIAASFHPGSVFKIVVASAGLETGVVDKNTLIEDTGVIKVGDYLYTNWLWNKRGATEGMVDIVKAIKRSNDIYFYKLGGLTGVDNIKSCAEKFGFGRKTGVELLGETAGLIPNEEWKIKERGEKWFLGNTYHMAIGQGDVNVTPLQVNQMTNVIANDGKKCQMSILADSKVNCQDLGISGVNLELIKDGMRAACKTGGTAWPLFNFKTEIACKT